MTGGGSVSWIRGPVGGFRSHSTAALGEKPHSEVKDAAAAGSAAKEEGIGSYWGVSPAKVTKEDETQWKWNCFRPWETYQDDLSIDLKKYHAPKTFMDKIAYWTVKSLRLPTNIFFQRRYGCRAMMLETVATVPRMVGGMLLHCKSLWRFEHSGGWIKALLEEAENERMHLMTFIGFGFSVSYNSIGLNFSFLFVFRRCSCGLLFTVWFFKSLYCEFADSC